ncbi:DUF4272 domain-containing protein [Pedobacter cryoconitis]|uniref:Uncharacterized protein DUF4272 n=1 Tax=Pedobacter cryoconitis TaxID=188932 RepID=A0A327RV73_9SPHI|nr:DUF4272 domain-containing protein [Pedobacter cryoconitis]RAJ19952.1 uncharacterized protein DUF4272 [Pedobacter cryoconitis]
MSTLIRQKTDIRLSENNLPKAENLPFLDNTNIRSDREVSIRSMILFALKSISIYPEDMQDIKEWLYEHFKESLSVYEKQSLSGSKLDEKSEIKFSWYQESLYVLLWCLSIVPHMSEPDKEADLESYLELFPPEQTIESFFERCKLRSVDELQLELDYYYNLHWLSRHRAELKMTTVDNLNKSVVLERRKALEWVVDEKLSWDDINLDT